MSPAVKVEIRARGHIQGVPKTAFWYECGLWGDLMVGWRNNCPHPMAVDGVRISEREVDGRVTILRIVDRKTPVLVKPDGRCVLTPEQVEEMVQTGRTSVYIVEALSDKDEVF